METAIINGICRCCASEGAFKDIRSAYQWMGAEEIYADMLKECFDLSLWSSGEGDDGGICEVCVTQLRNASNFKKQVLHTEEQFKKHLHTRLFKPSIVKVELPANDGIDSDDNISAEEGYSGTDYEVSAIKVESPEESKPKKRSAKMSTRASTSRAKKAKGDAGESSTKHAEKKRNPRKCIITLRPPKKTTIIEIRERPPAPPLKKIVSLQVKRKNDIIKHKENVETILNYSNATPIGRYCGIGYCCCSCELQFASPAELKKHTLDHHADYKTLFLTNKIYDTLSGFIIKLDITDLKCEICNFECDDLSRLTQHLKSEHAKKFNDNLKSHVIAFKFGGNSLNCAVCHTEFNNFKVLLEHMHSHYDNFVCSTCGSGFVNNKILLTHMYRHKKGEFKCTFCNKIFDTKVKQKDHERAIHICHSKRSKCGYCGEKFTDYTKKRDHEMTVHGAKPRVLKCQACDRVFDNQRSLNVHKKAYHLMEKRLTKKNQ